MRIALPCCVAAAASALVLTGCGSTSHENPAPPAVQVSVTSCGTGWAPKAAGQQHIVLADTDSRPGEVRLINPKTGAIFAQIEPIGPGTTADLDVSLAAGTYAVQCLMEDESAVVGPSVTITGAAEGAAGVLPVDQAELVPATKAYQAYVNRSLPGLVDLVYALAADIAAGRTSRARTDWLSAHLAYERLGAAYGAFGDLDAAINGLDDGLPGGVDDPRFTGFHRVEYGLWHGASHAALLRAVDALQSTVVRLGKVFASAQIDPLAISIRAHEIAENALQFELTGQDDYGSHSELATVSANLDGTRTVLAMISALLATRTSTLAAIDAQLTAAQHLVADEHTTAGWTPLSALATGQREQIDAALSQLCELLAPVASIVEPRRTS